jgi:hypothetical protein
MTPTGQIALTAGVLHFSSTPKGMGEFLLHKG